MNDVIDQIGLPHKGSTDILHRALETSIAEGLIRIDPALLGHRVGESLGCIQPVLHRSTPRLHNREPILKISHLTRFPASVKKTLHQIPRRSKPAQQERPETPHHQTFFQIVVVTKLPKKGGFFAIDQERRVGLGGIPNPWVQLNRSGCPRQKLLPVFGFGLDRQIRDRCQRRLPHRLQ